jgi:putative transposase
MDEAHLLAAARYVETNPLRAKLVRRSRDWRWSSARAHLAGRDDGLVTAAPLLDLVGDWAGFLAEGLEADALDAIRRSERTGRPLGSARFLKRLETKLGRILVKQKPGPKPQND